MPPFKDEHVLIIAPGSQITLAQLGLPESFTPATTRLRTRMFPTEDKKTWEPYKIRPVKKNISPNDGDVEMGGATGEGPQKDKGGDPEYEEDPESDEGAVYPLREGRIVNMPAFLALLNHIHNTLSPTLHTPILLIAQPRWTAQEHETITQFIFEKFKTPAFCIMDSALAVSYAYGVANATVIDVGYQKVDITTIGDFSVQHVGRTIALPRCGGDAMTQRLFELLGPKGWTRDMCEQLKKSPICEILPTGTSLPGSSETQEIVSNPAAAALTGAIAPGPSVKITEAPRASVADTDAGDEEMDGIPVVDDEGVLDVASIVASGKTQEFLAAQEKKKALAASRKAAKDARDTAENTTKPVKLPNYKRSKVIFHYQERRLPGESEDTNEIAKKSGNETAPEPKQQKNSEPKSATEISTGGNALAEGASKPLADSTVNSSISGVEQAARREQIKAAKREEKRKAREGQGDPTIIRKEIEVGIERFQAASGGILDLLADAIHRTILSVEEIHKRGDLWDCLIIVGNGSRVRGFKDALLSTLNNRYIISPSSATIFTSELPSNLSTPMGTGAQTPQREYPPGQHPLPTGSSVNPLLLAATTASNPALNPNLSLSSFGAANGSSSNHSHSSHSQSPTSIKTAKVPEYFPEFKNEGFEESVFLGAQVAAKVFFVQDQGITGGFLSRVQYNELGPSGIHEVGLSF